MTISEAYILMKHSLGQIYAPVESALIASYIFEDLIEKNFRSERLMNESETLIFRQSLQRLLNHEPWQYVTGKAEFYGLDFIVNESVLIPRPETEELTDHVVSVVKNMKSARVLDVGTGSGAIIISIAKKLQHIRATGIDISHKALKTAAFNAERHGANVNWRQLDFLDQSSWSDLGMFECIVSNPPYIGEEESKSMSRNVLDFEPHLALFATGDTFKFYRALADFTVQYTEDGGVLLVEINEMYANKVVEIFENAGLNKIEIYKDMQSKDRIVKALHL